MGLPVSPPDHWEIGSHLRVRSYEAAAEAGCLHTLALGDHSAKRRDGLRNHSPRPSERLLFYWFLCELVNAIAWTRQVTQPLENL